MYFFDFQNLEQLSKPLPRSKSLPPPDVVNDATKSSCWNIQSVPVSKKPMIYTNSNQLIIQKNKK